MHFGLYLKNKGIISAEQFVAALEAQLAMLPRIGQLALEEAILSPRDIFNVLHAQRWSPDVRFGELAIEMGLMTRNELMRLLMVQADRKRPFAEIVVSEGMLSEQLVAQEVDEFHRLQTVRRTGRVQGSNFVPAPRGQAVAIHGGELILAN